MNILTEQDLEIVKKYYQLYIDDIPEDKNNIWDFLETLSAYNYTKHHNDTKLEKKVSQIVDQYFVEKDRIIAPYYNYGESYEITDEQIKERKDKIISCIKVARDKNRCRWHTYQHYIGADAYSDELCNFYYYVYDNYYKSIGALWVNH